MEAQSTWILNQLRSGKNLTAIDALNGCGCFRLGARIYDLKQQGHKIRSEMVTLQNGKRVAKYFLIEGRK